MQQRIDRKIALGIPDKVQILCVLYITVWAISPPLAYGTAYRIVAVAATSWWLFIEFLKRPSTFFRPSVATASALIFVAYSAIVGYMIEGFSDIVRNFQIYIFLLFLVFYESYRKRDVRQLRIVFWGALSLFPIWLWLTYRTYGQVHNVSRILVRSSEVALNYRGQGVGGYELVYSMIVAIPVLLYLFKYFYRPDVFRLSSSARILPMGLILTNLILGSLVIIKAGYSISVIIFAISIVITIIIGKRSTLLVFRASCTFLIIVLLYFYFFVPIMELLANLSKGTMYERKFHDLVSFIANEQITGTLALRTERYLRSVKLFFENPIVGTLSFSHIGKHSAILDRYARYGIFVGTLFAYTVFYLPLQILKRQRGKNFGMASAVAFVVICFSFLNNLFSSYGFMVFIFYPLAMSYIEDNARDAGHMSYPKIDSLLEGEGL